MKRISATLLKRLGEAAHGYRGTPEVYIAAEVADAGGLEVFTSEVEASKYISSKEDWQVFGPYGSASPTSGTERRISSVEVKLTYQDGETRTKSYPADTDAVFLSMSAIEKFAIPYYTQLYGVEYAAAMWQRMAKFAHEDGGHIKKTTWIP